MKKLDFDAAVKAAKEFLEQAKRVTIQPESRLVDGGREAATLKRRSMDLTRALADLRHPYREKK